MPSGYEKGKKYPGILEIHGGPKAAYGEVDVYKRQVPMKGLTADENIKIITALIVSDEIYSEFVNSDTCMVYWAHQTRRLIFSIRDNAHPKFNNFAVLDNGVLCDFIEDVYKRQV